MCNVEKSIMSYRYVPNTQLISVLTNWVLRPSDWRTGCDINTYTHGDCMFARVRASVFGDCGSSSFIRERLLHTQPHTHSQAHSSVPLPRTLAVNLRLKCTTKTSTPLLLPGKAVVNKLVLQQAFYTVWQSKKAVSSYL